MTDKVQIIREEVEIVVNRRLNLLNGDYFDLNKETDGFTNEIMGIIDSMQEEPVSRTPADVESAMQEIEEKSKAFTDAHQGEDTDTILAQMRGEEPVNKQNLSNVERTIKEWKEETVSEGLGEYINELSKQFPEVSFAKLSRIAVRVAKWQKEQDKSTIELAEDHAMLAGMEKMKEEMMAKAVDATIGLPYENKNGEYTHLVDVSRPLPVGDNKIAIIFKDE